MDLKAVIREIPDFPIKGVLFRDITPVLADPAALKESIDLLTDAMADLDFDLIAGPESRGFIFSTPIAYNLGKGFIPVRKAGKLPSTTIRKEYDLEYGKAVIEMHADAIEPGQKVIIVDDLLATGGTSRAIVEMVEAAGGIVSGLVYLIELVDLNGRELLPGYDVRSIVKY